MSSSYPGNDPDDPFARPPKEDGNAAAGVPEETAPIRPEEAGYWERLAQQGNPAGEQPGQQPGEQPPGNPWAGYGQPATPSEEQPGSYPPPPAGQGYAPGYPPAGQGYAPAYGYQQPAYTGYARPQQPQATTAMVLGLVSLIGGFLTCGLLFLMAPFAWAIGARSKREIASSNGQLGGEGNAHAGFVMGIIGTVLLVLGIVAVVLFVVVIVNSTSSTYGSTDF